MSVFCSKCIFFVKGERIPFPFGDPKCFDRKSYNTNPPSEIECEKKEQCLSPNNFKSDYENEQYIPVSVPSVINQFNNCKWFEESPSSDSSSCSSSAE